ncbi:MAG: DUF3108 domain-containing protein [Acidobacteriota bacterium]|nr:DUF3108 domain-containing protein [Acidobacteriota bacterium]
MMRLAPALLALALLAAAPLTAAQRPAPPSPAAPSANQSAAPRPAPDVITTNTRIIPPPANHKFPNGQTLVYDVEWRLWRAGSASIRLDAAGAEERITGTADSSGVVSLLYGVHDRFETFFDAKTFCSRQITKNTEEGFRKRQTQIRFDHARGKAVLDEKDLKKGTAKHVENDIPACATDVLSGIFYVASLPLAPNVTYTLPLNDGGKTAEVKVTVEAREKIKTPAGEFNTVRVQPESLAGLVKSRGRIWLWYTDDAAHTPVQMRAKMGWGTLTFRLTRIERK